MTEPVLLHVQPKDLSQDDMFWLGRARDSMYNPPNIEQLAKAVFAEELQVWRVVAAKARGVVVTMVNEKPLGNELMVFGFCGKSLMPLISDIFVELKSLAAVNGCRCLYAFTILPSLGYKMEKVGFKKVGTLHRVELGA